MKWKLIVTLCITLGYVIVTFGANAASKFCSVASICSSTTDGTNPPHAVDISGKAIPASSADQPDKPIILAKDSLDSFGEFEKEHPFDHTKHSTDIKYSVDGKSVPSCVECHHTEQPSAPKGQEYLKRFDRKETLTAKQLETSKQPVQSCRACHFQEATEPTAEFPPQLVNPPKGKPSGKLTNDAAYHTNCNSCHRAAKKRDSKTKAPTGCSDCHTSK